MQIFVAAASRFPFKCESVLKFKIFLGWNSSSRPKKVVLTPTCFQRYFTWTRRYGQVDLMSYIAEEQQRFFAYFYENKFIMSFKVKVGILLQM